MKDQPVENEVIRDNILPTLILKASRFYAWQRDHTQSRRC